ncbi:unnamed protein product [Chrysoparadoxa australica]
MDTTAAQEEKGACQKGQSGSPIPNDCCFPRDGAAMDLDHEIVAEAPCAVYSWGRGDLGALLQGDATEKDIEDSRVVLRNNRQVVDVATSLYHSAAVTSTGAVLCCGTNIEGQVDISVHDSEQDGKGNGELPVIMQPVIVESLQVQRIVEVSCGLLHTACLTSTHSVITFGGNESGQLGHSIGKLDHVKPRTMEGLDGLHKGVQVVCGDFFTLVRTLSLGVLACGASWCKGSKEDEPGRATLIKSFAGVSITDIAAGGSHCIALSAMGSVFSWGLSNHGQCGTVLHGKDAVQVMPMRIRVGEAGREHCIAAACGDNHTLLITKERVWGCGLNKHNQLGLGPDVREVKGGLSQVPLPAGLAGTIVSAACGIKHSMLLSDKGLVYTFGDNSSKQLGRKASSVDKDEPSSVEEKEEKEEKKAEELTAAAMGIGEVKFLRGKGVRRVVAGGEQSFALAAMAADQGNEPTITGGGLLSRQFSSIGVTKMNDLSTKGFLALISAARTGGDGPQRLAHVVQLYFSSPALLNMCFLRDVPSKCDHCAAGECNDDDSVVSPQRVFDIEGVEEAYRQLLGLGDGLVELLLSSMQHGLATMQEIPGHKHSGEVLVESYNWLLVMWQCPLLAARHSASSQLFLSICNIILGLPSKWHRCLMTVIRENYPPHIFTTRLVQPAHALLSHHLGIERGRGTAVPTSTLILSWLVRLNEMNDTLLVPYTTFCNDSICALPIESLFDDLLKWKALDSTAVRKEMRFCSYPFLLDVKVKRDLLRAEAQAGQRAAAEQAVSYDEMHNAFVFRPYHIIQVERENLLRHTLHQVAHTDPRELQKQLKVVFIGEEGVDEGGVRKEFFQLLISQLFDLDFGMFNTLEYSSDLWFSQGCTWSDEEYSLIGILLGLALYNNVLLDIHFPMAVYKKLLAQKLGLADLKDFDPGLLKGLQQLLDYMEDDLEDVFCQTFEVSWTSLGETHTHELVEGGKDKPVTQGNKKLYIQLYVHWLLTESVAQQFDSFARGFHRVMEGASLSLLRAEELELLLAGEPHLDMRELERGAKYEGYTTDSPTVKAFWEVVHELSLPEQQRFLAFTTGSMKAPLGGLGNLSILIQRAGPDSENLPSSHTCFNSLLLPDYGSKEKLKPKLGLALTEFQGFGLK